MMRESEIRNVDALATYLDLVRQDAAALLTDAAEFDLVTAFELLEHVYDPDAFVRAAAHVVKPGGRCFFTTLNGGGFDIQVPWQRSQSVSPPHHLNFFTPHATRLLLERGGLQVESITTPGRLDWDIVERAVGEGTCTDRLWSLIARDATEAAKEELQDWIARHGFSSHMWMLGRRAP